MILMQDQYQWFLNRICFYRSNASDEILIDEPERAVAEQSQFE